MTAAVTMYFVSYVAGGVITVIVLGVAMCDADIEPVDKWLGIVRGALAWPVTLFVTATVYVYLVVKLKSRR